MNPPAPRIRALDGVRALAIAMVLAWHFIAVVPRLAGDRSHPLLERLLGLGWTGVTLFFVLSGFLIGRILIRTRGQPGYYRTFWLRRACRILPLYFACLAGYRLALVLAPAASPATLSGLLRNDSPFWTFPVLLQNYAMAAVHNLGGDWLAPTWSLAVEEQAYLLLPLAVAVLPPRWLGAAAAAALFGAAGLRALSLHTGTADMFALVVILPSRVDAFALGVLIAHAEQNAALPSAAVTRGLLVTSAALVGLFVCFGLPPTVTQALAFRATLLTLLALLFSTLVLHLVVRPDGRVAWFFNLRPLSFLGGVSYFVYLFHQPANYAAHLFWKSQSPRLETAGDWWITVFAVVFVIAAAAASMRCFEGPIIAWGRRPRPALVA